MKNLYVRAAVMKFKKEDHGKLEKFYEKKETIKSELFISVILLCNIFIN